VCKQLVAIGAPDCRSRPRWRCPGGREEAAGRSEEFTARHEEAREGSIEGAGGREGEANRCSASPDSAGYQDCQLAAAERRRLQRVRRMPRRYDEANPRDVPPSFMEILNNPEVNIMEIMIAKRRRMWRRRIWTRRVGRGRRCGLR
jgi:hypothetical protein